MGLKYKRTLYRATWFTVVVVTISLAIQVYLKKWQSQIDLLVPVQESDTLNTPILTVWDIIKSDGNVSVFAKMVGEFDDIVGGLKVPQAKFTVYAPTNEAFKKEEFEHDLPLFYYQFLVGHHMGPGVYSAEALSTTNTVPTFVNADIFFKYRQRISTQIESGTCSLNRKARLVQPNIVSLPQDGADIPQAAVNGIVHHIDRVLMLPDSTADILRNWPEFSTMRRGLIQSGLAVTINDTSTHVGQTLFVPSDAAFEKLGPKVNKFLFSPWGNRYLEALLKYHVVANRTLFSDVYFQANGKGQIASKEGSEVSDWTPMAQPHRNVVEY